MKKKLQIKIAKMPKVKLIIKKPSKFNSVKILSPRQKLK
jgi:hypothetical protein